MSEDELYETEKGVMADWLKGNESAIELAFIIGTITQVWDDLIDQDKPVHGSDINAAFMAAMIDLPRNAFYQQFFHELQPIIENFIINWLMANQFEAKGDRHGLSLAYVLKADIADFVIRLMTIIGGVEYAAKRGAEVRAYYHADETLEAYLEEQHGKRD